MPAESYDAVKTRLLVVDDDKKLCRLIKDYLEPLGYDVVTVHTGRQGLEKALVLRDCKHASELDSLHDSGHEFTFFAVARFPKEFPASRVDSERLRVELESARFESSKK